MKSLAFFDKNEMKSLEKWQEKLASAGGNCLFECGNENDSGFMFAFQTKEQQELIKSARVMCLHGTHGMNHHGYHLFTLVIRHPKTGSGYPVAFLISKFKRSVTLIKWLNYLKLENEMWKPDIFMVDDAGEEIKAVETCFSDSTVLLCHFHVLRSWRRKLGHKHGATTDPYKEIIWKDLWRLMKTEGWNDEIGRAHV